MPTVMSIGLEQRNGRNIVDSKSHNAFKDLSHDAVGSERRHRATAHTARPRIRASVSRDVPVYSPSFHWVLNLPTHRGMTQAE